MLGQDGIANQAELIEFRGKPKIADCELGKSRFAEMLLSFVRHRCDKICCPDSIDSSVRLQWSVLVSQVRCPLGVVGD